MTQSPNLKTNNYQHLEEIVQLTVETTRKTLKCDRVIIYDASELLKSKVIAESVDSQYASIVGKTIINPFLAGDYLELYCYGQVVAIDNIYDTHISKSKLEDLERLKIKSLLVAPISVNQKLLAFLVAHQCSEFRAWNSETSKFLTEKANMTGFALSNIVKAQKSESSENKSIPLSPSSNNEVLEAAQQIKNQNNNSSLRMDREKNGHENILPSEQQTKIQENKTKLFSDINDRIAAQLGQENIFNTTVNELRYLLECDRVVVYSLDKDNYGVVAAESVAPQWNKAKGRVIDDPCLAVRYIEEYKNGRVRAIDDIHSASITPCYLEQLEELQVKANLVAPIVSEDQLFGLLIAHHCSNPRHWQEQEINWITEIGDQVGLMLEYTETIADNDSESQKLLAASENKWNHHFTDAIQYIRQSLNQEDILKASVKEVRRVLECDRVVVYSLNRDLRYGAVIAESVAPGWTRALNKQIDDPCFEPTYRDKYRNGRVRAWNNIYETGMTKCYVEQLEELEVKANLVAPIINEGKLFGLLVAHQCSDFRTWQQPEVRWVAQIATQVGFALDNAKLLADAKQLQHQLENEAKMTQYFTDAVRYIRESLHQEDILEVSVEEVRRVLNCDRVVVYSLNQKLRYGAVIAESVAAGWTRALNKQIDDPCFEPTYREKYRNGRVRAWSNIYEAGMTKCYIEQLEDLQVKANLVTPIVNEGKLFGLLVAHQCSDFRNWQQPEIRWVTQIATQVAFALDNAKSLAEAKRLQQQVEDENKWTEYFTDAIGHIRESLKTEDILKSSVQEVRRILECDRVVVYSLNQDLRYGTVLAESVAPGWTRALGQKIDDPCFEPTYRDKYLNGRVRAWNNIYEAGMTKCYIEQLKKLEVKASLVTPIINEGKLFGLLVAHQCSDIREWQQAEIRWIAQIAMQVGFALDNAKLLEQLQESTQTNKQISHQQYEQTETLKNQVVEILVDNGDAYQTLSQEAMRQSETTINVLHQIQKVADSFNGIALNVQQVKFQEQQNELAVHDTQASLDRAVDSISNIQRKVQGVAVGFDNLSNSSEKLAETVNTIRDLSKQIVQHSMSITRAVNRSQIEASSQNSVMDLSDTIFSLMQQLYEASAKVEPLFVNIQTEIREKTITLDSGTQQLINGVGEFQAVRQKLDRVVTLYNKVNSLIENISRSVENQTQSSTFAKDSVQEVASIAERISAQSMTITQSFNQLVVLVQKL
ncbi:GAF domain-containing protein [Pleurocapsa sp. FMAR1]|uniref:GAF domain-containing protein n=1 Tax=Pleurocapsa sp. FMAR1 TaxID=3040204 RepID=UPI0029C94493|nr:GAF domain-containing protein [Pleurocapsa sp. FMAR1]